MQERFPIFRLNSKIEEGMKGKWWDERSAGDRHSLAFHVNIVKVLKTWIGSDD